MSIITLPLTNNQKKVFYDNTNYYDPEYYSYVYEIGKDDNEYYNYLIKIGDNRYIYVKNHAWNLKSRKLDGFEFKTKKAYKTYDNCESIIIDFTITDYNYIINGYMYNIDLYNETIDKSIGNIYNYKSIKKHVNEINPFYNFIVEESLNDLYNQIKDIKNEYNFIKPNKKNTKYLCVKSFTEEEMSNLFLKH